MAQVSNVIKISKADYDTLASGGTITKNGATYSFDENAIYLVNNGLDSNYVMLGDGTGKPITDFGGGTFVISDFNNIYLEDIMVATDGIDASPTITPADIIEAMNAGKTIIVVLQSHYSGDTYEYFTATVDKCLEDDLNLVLDVSPVNHNHAGKIYINIYDNGASAYNWSAIWVKIPELQSNAIASKYTDYGVTGAEAWKKIHAGYTIMTSQTSLTLTNGGNHNVAIIPTSTTARTITLPAGSADGETFTIRRLFNGVSAAVTVKCASTNSFQLCNSSSTYTYSTGYSLSTSLYRAVRFIFYSNKWYIVTDD